jgi:hypothetical protein
MASPPVSTRPPTSERWSLRVEAGRGLEWVRYVWRTLGRLGGPLDILLALVTLLRLLTRRTLVQWGLIRGPQRRRR